jgi:hypothetical protein
MSIDRKKGKQGQKTVIELGHKAVLELMDIFAAGSNIGAQSTHDTWGFYHSDPKVILKLLDRMSKDLIMETKRIKKNRRTYVSP